MWGGEESALGLGREIVPEGVAFVLLHYNGEYSLAILGFEESSHLTITRSFEKGVGVGLPNSASADLYHII